MAKSLEEALIRAGVVDKDDSPRARQQADWERRRRDAEAETKARMDDPPPPPFDAPATGRVVDKPAAPPVGATRSPVTEEDADSGPPRTRGQMVWLHKSVPVLEIEGRKPLSPDEIASGRRR